MNFYTLICSLALLVIANRAWAQSWYQDIPDQTVAAGQVLLLDVDNDNSSDLAISGNFINSQLFFAFSTPTMGNVGSRNVQMLSNGSNTVAQLQAGQNVFVNSGNFIGGQSNTCVICINNSSIWQGGSSDTYVGFRLEKISDNQIHYGWLRLSVNNTVSQLTIKEIGFQRSPNAAIEVGFIPISSLQIQTSSQLLSIDDAQLQLQTQILPSNASNPTVRWSVDNPIVAAVNQQGLLTALADGQVLVRAEANDDSGLWDTVRIFVSNQIVPVNRINLNSSTNIITARNGSLQISVDVLPSYATNSSVRWSVDNLQIASVDNNGLLTAKANGTVNVVATSQDGSRVSGYWRVEISGQFVPVASLSIQGAGFINSPHGSSQLVALVSPANADIQSVTWSVDSPHIAEINPNGLLQAHKNGAVRVTATAADGSGVQTSQIINISGQYIPVDSVRIVPVGAPAINTNKGSLQLNAVLLPANATNSHFHWQVTDTSLAEIASNGLLKAKNNGTAQVLAICQDNSGRVGRIFIPISNQITKCQSLQIQSATGFFSISGSMGSLQLQAAFSPANTSNQNVVWAVSNPNIAQINNAGLLYGQENGTVTVSAISQDGSGAMAQAVISISGQSVRMNSLQIQGNSSISTPYGSSQLSLLYSPSNASNPLVYWSCDRPNVAVVSQSGLVQALANGTVTITATAQDGSGLSASFSVLISNQKLLINSLNVQSGRGSLAISQARDTLQLYPIFSPIAANPPPFFWKSSNPLVATITNGGLLSAVSNGSVTVTAISQDGSGLSAQAVVSVSNQPILTQSVSISSTGGAAGISSPYGELQLQATISPTNASIQRVSWSVDSPQIAFINPNGLLVAKSNGNVQVRAQTMDGSEVAATFAVSISNQILPIQTLDITASRNFINSNGDTLHLYPNLSPINANNTNIVWRSNNEQLASVSAQGLLTARANGTVLIIATAQDISGLVDTFAVSISNQKTAISSLTVSEQSAQTAINSPNGQLQLIYNYSPATASSPSVVWSLSDNQIGRIFPDGRLIALRNGSVWAKASAADGSNVSDSILISVSNQLVLLDSLQLQAQAGNSSITATAGSLHISAAFFPINASNTSVVYQSLQPAIAKVSQSGQVFAYANGTAQIVALSQDGSGKTDTLSISISNQAQPITAISINSPSSAIGTAGGSLLLSALISPSNASYQNVFWSVSDTNLAHINPQGLLKAKADGTVVVTAAAMDGSGVSATFAVSISNQPIWVESIQVQGLSGQNVININNQTLQMEAIVQPLLASNSSVRWQIVGGGTGWAIINPSSGLLTPRHNGTVTVRATAQDGSAIYGEAVITISNQTAPNPSVGTVSISAPATFINQDDNKLQLTATLSPAAANLNRIWSVRPAALAQIDQSGLLSPLADGQVTVTVAAVSNGLSDSFVVAISGQHILIQNLSISAPATIQTPNGQAQVVASISPANANNQTIIYTVGQPHLAHIDGLGQVTAFADGVVDIWAYSQDGSGKIAHQQLTISNQISPISSLVLATQGGSTSISSPYGELATVCSSSPSIVPIYYSSSNPATASINPQGNIQAADDGITWIRAQALDGSGLADSVQISVSNQPILTQSVSIAAPFAFINQPQGSVSLTATQSPSNISNPSLLWYVSDPNIAAVSQQGIVTALRNGQLTVTVASQDGSGAQAQYAISISNQPIIASAISISSAGGQTSINQPFASLQLSANISPSNASIQQVYWSIDDPAIATLLPNGKIYAKQNGSTTVRARTLDGSYLLAALAISVQNQPTRVQQLVISKSSNTVLSNQSTAQISVTTVPAAVSNGQVLIQSLQPAIANINAHGLLTAVQNGFVYIKAYAQDSSQLLGLDSVFIGNQHQAANSVQITAPSAFEINQPNGLLQLTATAFPFNNNPTAFNWQSSNPAVATIYPNGLLVARSNGLVTITATAADGSQTQQTQTVTVSNQSVQIAAISLSNSNNIHTISSAGGSLQLQATISPSNASNPNLYYYSSNNNIATINQQGLVSAHSDGNCILMARSLDGGNIVATYSITVSNQPIVATSFGIQTVSNGYQISSSEGTLQFQATFNPLTSSNQTLAWSLNPSNIATIDDNGLLTAYQNGVVAVSAQTLDGSQLSATRFVTISNQSVYINGIQIGSSTGGLFINQPFGSLQLSATVSPSNASNAALTWWVSDPAIASISASGLLLAAQNGVVTVYAKALDRGSKIDSAQIVVSNQPIYTQQIAISYQPATAVINQPNGSLQLLAPVSPSFISNPNVYWWVDNPAIATISQTGLLRANANGIVLVSVQAQDKSGLLATVAVTVSNQSSSVAVADIDLFSAVPNNSISSNGFSLQLLANVFPANATNPALGWSVDRLDIIRVDAQGLLTPTGNGSAMAFAHSSDGSRVSALLEISVSNQLIAVRFLSAAEPTWSASAFPNPFTDFIRIKTQSLQGGDMFLELYDPQGRLLWQTTQQVGIGEDWISLENIPSLTPSFYVLRLRHSGTQQSFLLRRQ